MCVEWIAWSKFRGKREKAEEKTLVRQEDDAAGEVGMTQEKRLMYVRPSSAHPSCPCKESNPQGRGVKIPNNDASGLLGRTSSHLGLWQPTERRNPRCRNKKTKGSELGRSTGTSHCSRRQMAGQDVFLGPERYLMAWHLSWHLALYCQLPAAPHPPPPLQSIV